MKRIFYIMLPLALIGCGQLNAVLTASGVDPTKAATIDNTVTTIAAAALQDGQLVCQYGPMISDVAAVANVKVTHASSASVAKACADMTLAGEVFATAKPVPLPPTVTTLPVATVPQVTAMQVIASKATTPVPSPAVHMR